MKDSEDEIVYFSKADMVAMKAKVGDLVYITNTREWLGGLKSIHFVFTSCIMRWCNLLIRRIQ